MPVKEVTTPHPLIDADPHFSRVVRYMRPSDVGCIAGGTALAPALLYAWGTCPACSESICKLTVTMCGQPERIDRSTVSRRQIVPALRLAGFLGFTAGFLYAYQRSSRKSVIHGGRFICCTILTSIVDLDLQSGSGAGLKISGRRNWISRS